MEHMAETIADVNRLNWILESGRGVYWEGGNDIRFYCINIITGMCMRLGEKC